MTLIVEFRALRSQSNIIILQRKNKIKIDGQDYDLRSCGPLDQSKSDPPKSPQRIPSTTTNLPSNDSPLPPLPPLLCQITADTLPNPLFLSLLSLSSLYFSLFIVYSSVFTYHFPLLRLCPFLVFPLFLFLPFKGLLCRHIHSHSSGFETSPSSESLLLHMHFCFLNLGF